VNECQSQKIPVVVVTDGEPDRRESEDALIAAAFSLCRPVDASQFVRLVSSVEEFWFTIVRVGPTVG
jgi:two-component system response regulator